MKQHRIMVCALAALSLLFGPMKASVADPSQPTVDQLESELSGITDDLSRIERRIDGLLQELIDPRVTSLSVFFSVQGLEGRVPVALELLVDGKPLTTKTFSETDRLVLIRGGAIEVFAGITEPVKQALSVQYSFALTDGGRAGETSGRTVFNLEPRRASANFVEISLAPDPARKPGSVSLSARTWSKEP